MAQTILILYAVVMALVGLEAFVVKHSAASLAGGLAASILALTAAKLSQSNAKAGIGLGIAVVILLSGRFLGSLLKGTGGFWPAGFIVGISGGTVIALIVAIMQHRSLRS